MGYGGERAYDYGCGGGPCYGPMSWIVDSTTGRSVQVWNRFFRRVTFFNQIAGAQARGASLLVADFNNPAGVGALGVAVGLPTLGNCDALILMSVFIKFGRAIELPVEVGSMLGVFSFFVQGNQIASLQTSIQDILASDINCCTQGPSAALSTVRSILAVASRFSGEIPPNLLEVLTNDDLVGTIANIVWGIAWTPAEVFQFEICYETIQASSQVRNDCPTPYPIVPTAAKPPMAEFAIPYQVPGMLLPVVTQIPATPIQVPTPMGGSAQPPVSAGIGAQGMRNIVGGSF